MAKEKKMMFVLWPYVFASVINIACTRVHLIPYHHSCDRNDICLLKFAILLLDACMHSFIRFLSLLFDEQFSARVPVILLFFHSRDIYTFTLHRIFMAKRELKSTATHHHHRHCRHWTKWKYIPNLRELKSITWFVKILLLINIYWKFSRRWNPILKQR